jgi:hypothetical protein
MKCCASNSNSFTVMRSHVLGRPGPATWAHSNCSPNASLENLCSLMRLQSRDAGSLGKKLLVALAEFDESSSRR